MARTHENVEKIREIIKEDRRRTIEEIVELSGVTWSSVQRILTEDLGMKRVAAKFVPRLLTAEQKQGRVEACCALKEDCNSNVSRRGYSVTLCKDEMPTGILIYGTNRTSSMGSLRIPREEMKTTPRFTKNVKKVFFVLRKKQNQVTFLHVYHHTITALFSWGYLKFLPGEQGLVIGFLNSLVHVVMYFYYMMAAMGPKYQKYLWWKKYMTWIQLAQFCIMLTYLLCLLAYDCKFPKALTFFFISNVIIFLYLFSDFYRKAYKKKEKLG
ncbi:hypothetical protein B7P43_G15791 [Cryptotermes secundus]|uniref:Elongation of very long chain fatty acids protein n=1 Tax=Cryptotermes secundus TaxID=105785 RepID=A0A2J7RM08_9NEOP|nr:hypothetical protein B7P43_G15791 [Cryptotermes secundus]